jgi:hypothetical protein
MNYGKRLMSTLWAGFLALVILAVGQGMWGALLWTNLQVDPATPWSAAVMALML